MLTVKLSAEQVQTYKGQARAKILAAARAQARKAGEATVRIVGPSGLLEQFLSGVEQTAPEKRTGRSSHAAKEDGLFGFSPEVFDSMRQSVEATAQRLASKRPKMTMSCLAGRHFLCDGSVVKTGKTCECSCHGNRG